MSRVDAQKRFWIPILLYHRVVPALPAQDPYGNCVSVAVFEKQLQWLSNHGYRSVSLRDVERCFGETPEPLPRRSFVITFDDGYRDNYLHAWPLLQRYGFTATIFLVTSAIGGDNGFDVEGGDNPATMLSAAEIGEMHAQGTHFESHTCSHPNNLTEMPDDELQTELTRSRTDVERVTGTQPRYFAYPHSRLDERAEAAVAQAGYALACGGVGTRFSRFCLHRIELRERQGMAIGVHLRERHLKWLLKSGRRG